MPDRPPDFESAVTAVLKSSAPGDVFTYGELAAEAGFPGAARAVGTLLSRSDGLPWWRVVAASGRLNPNDPVGAAARLRIEGHRVEPNRSGELRILG